MGRKRRIVLVGICAGILGAVLLIVWSRPKPEVLYRVVFLPSLGRSGSPRAINDRGHVVGVAEVTQNQWHLFRWDREGGIKDLGPCADPRQFEGVLINNAAQIAATAMDPNGKPYAFVQDPNGTRHILPAPAGEEIHLRGLNQRGQVVGFCQPPRGPRRAFLWDRAAGMQDLAPAATIESLAAGINDAGQVVGFASLPRTNQWHAFLWDPNAGLRDLGLARFGPTQAGHINNRGFVVGQFGSVEDHTCLSTWTAGTGAQRLHAPRGTWVQTAGLNDDNRFLVCTERPRFALRAFASVLHLNSYLCDPNGHVTDLASSLDLPDVYEFFATGINNQGQIIGLLRSDRYANPQGVVLVPIK